MKQNFRFILVFLFLALTMSFVSAYTININFYDESTLSAIPTVTVSGHTIDNEPDNYALATSGTSNNSYGYRILANQTVNLARINKNASCTGTIAYLKNDAGTVIAQASFSGNVANFTSTPELTSGSYYRIEVDNAGATYTKRSTPSAGYPYNSTYISYISGSFNGVTSTSANNIDSIDVQVSTGSSNSDVNGLWSGDLVGQRVLSISKTGYDSRPLEFYFTEDANYNFLLNPTGLDSSIGFIVKDTNDNLWTNKYLMFADINKIPTTEYLHSYVTNDYFNSESSPTLIKTFDFSSNPIYISKIENQIKVSSSAYTVYNKITFDYYDSTTDVNITNNTNSTSYVLKTYTNPNPNNPVSKIYIYLHGDSTASTYYSYYPKVYSIGKWINGLVIINSLLTSSSGTATASLLANGDYNALLYDATGTLVDTYEKTTVTVNKPKNEVTLGAISPYDITVGGLLGYSLTNQSASSVSFNIFAGTEGFYYFSVVDYNAVPADRKYIPRQYFTQVPMGTGYSSALTYQPYLLLETDAVVPKITVLDQLNKPIGDVDIFISRSINNVQTIVESGKTTSTGNMSFSAYPLEYYYINVIYNGVDKGTFRVQPRESSDNFIIVIDTSDDVVDTGELIITADFSGTPKVVNIDGTNINADITITQSLNQATSYNLYLIQNNVTKASTSGAISGLVTSIDYDFDSSVVDRFNNNLTLKLVVNYPDGNQTFYYTITATKNAKGLMYFAPQIINDIGQPLGIILAILITGIILATLTFSGLNISPTAITILGVLILGVFMFLGWLDTGITVLGFDIARFFYVLMAIAMIYFMMRGEQYA